MKTPPARQAPPAAAAANGRPDHSDAPADPRHPAAGTETGSRRDHDHPPPAAGDQPGSESDDPEPDDPPSGGQGEPKKRRGPLPLLVLAAVVLLAATGGVLYYLHARNYEVTDDAFVEGHVISVSPKVAAHVVALHFEDNSEVERGQLLVELDPRDFAVALERAQAQLAQARAQVLQYRAQIDQSRAQLAKAQAQALQTHAQFQIAEINFNRNSSLFQRDLRAVAKADVDSTRASFDAARATNDAAEADVAATRAAGEAAEAQLAAAEAAVRTSEAAVHDAELQLSYTRINAVAAGRVTRRTVEAGNYVQPGNTLFSLVPHDVWITANYKETQLARMRVGQPAEVKVDAFPGRRLRAHVDSLQLGTGSRFSLLPAENATGNYVKVVQRVPVKLVFDESADVLRALAPGESVEPRVDVRGGSPAR